ncbi:MAG: hypothetical protein ACTSXZ_06970, partial [Alphaproteobacteria bacterium]
MSTTPLPETPANLKLVHCNGARAGQFETSPESQFVEDLRIVAGNLMRLADRVPDDRAEIVRTASDLVAGIAD